MVGGRRPRQAWSMTRCLIVDDSPQFAAVAARLLEAAGIDVLGVAGNCRDALLLTERLQPDVVLIDVELGPECGTEVARLLSARTGNVTPAVILMSARSRDDLGPLIEDTPAVGFLTKHELSGPAVERLLTRSWSKLPPRTAAVRSASSPNLPG